VTHDQEEALSLSDYIAVMHDGRLEQMGTPHEVYNSPRTMFAADFTGPANFIEIGGENCLVRPEWLTLESGENALTGVVVSGDYFGRASRVRVRLENGTAIAVETGGDQAIPEEGTRVQVGIRKKWKIG